MRQWHYQRYIYVEFPVQEQALLGEQLCREAGIENVSISTNPNPVRQRECGYVLRARPQAGDSDNDFLALKERLLAVLTPHVELFDGKNIAELIVM